MLPSCPLTARRCNPNRPRRAHHQNNTWRNGFAAACRSWKSSSPNGSKSSVSPCRALRRQALSLARRLERDLEQIEEQLKVFYQRLRIAGKPAKVALTAVMRTLIVLMNHLLKNPNLVLQD